MAHVLGLGGIFFRSKDPKALGAWYAKYLNLNIEESFGGSVFMPMSMPEGGYSLWTPFPQDSDYFKREQPFMINLIVDNLDEALAQVKEGGAAVEGPNDEPGFGRFGWFIDPDGNKVELWEPSEKVPES